MVEGGAQIIHQFLTIPTSEDGKPLVDLLVVTVAPVLVPDGLAVPGGETSVSSAETVSRCRRLTSGGTG